MSYKLTNDGSIIRQADGAQIPIDDGNRDYHDYLVWLAAGNVATPPAPPTPIGRNSVTMRQARLALLQAGLLDPVNQAVAAMPGAEGDAARIEWEFSSTVDRQRPLVQALAAALGWSEAQLDALFIAADAL